MKEEEALKEELKEETPKEAPGGSICSPELVQVSIQQSHAFQEAQPKQESEAEDPKQDAAEETLQED